MSSNMWRLYRHVLIGGVIVLLTCYAAIETLQKRDVKEQQLRFLHVDAELSAQLYLSGISTDQINAYSQFTWRAMAPATSIAKGATTTADVVEQANEMRARVLLTDTDRLLLEGTRKAVLGSDVAGLLKYFLKTDATDIEKLSALRALDDIAVTSASVEQWNVSDNDDIVVVQNTVGELAVLWQPTDEQAWLIDAIEKRRLPLSIAVLVMIVVSIGVLWVIVWFELIGLDKKRMHFETATRQIARGRGSLPQGVEDSSGTLKELAYSFDSMSTHIQRLLKVQREMINAISHELRTPIARLRFGLEVLKDDAEDTQVSSIDALELDVEELNTLVDEVLTYGKLEEGSLALNFEKTSIGPLLHDIVDHNQSLLNNLDVQVEVGEQDIVNADAHHLNRALQNLILNAAKYANSKIKITFSADEERWQVDIEDDGPGIPLEDRDKVFIPFQRLDNSRTRASGGYGLGLAIVQRIAFWHGGAVLVDESDIGGAKFSFIWSRSQHQNSLG